MEFTFLVLKEKDKRRKRNKEKQETRKKVIKIDEEEKVIKFLNLGEKENEKDDVN